MLSDMRPIACPCAEDAATGAPQPACDALQQLLALESRQQGADGGRPAGKPGPEPGLRDARLPF